MRPRGNLNQFSKFLRLLRVGIPCQMCYNQFIVIIGLRKMLPPSAAGKKMKISSRVLILFLFVVVLVTVLLPQPILAQKERTDLYLTLVSARYPNEVVPGEDNRFFLEVRNVGNRAINNIRLSSINPEGWAVDFSPSRLDYLGPGSFQTVDINIKPAVKAAEGNYKVTFVAEANEIRKVQVIEFRVDKGTWLWIGGIILLVVVVGFIFVFMRFSRQK